MDRKERMRQKRINQQIIGKNIGSWMKKMNMNQIELAMSVDVTPYNVDEYIHGYKMPNVTILYGMAKKLKCRTDDLLEGVIT